MYIYNCQIYKNLLLLLAADIKELNRNTGILVQRIFIVTESFTGFPVSILHNSKKYFFENQKCFINKVKNTPELAFEEFDLSDKDPLSNFVNSTLYKRLVFSMCFLYALMTERA